MTPLLHKFIQECEHPVPDVVDTLPLGEIHIFKSIFLKYNLPTIYSYDDYDYIDVDVGSEWIETNLSDEEYAELVAMRLRGQIT